MQYYFHGVMVHEGEILGANARSVSVVGVDHAVERRVALALVIRLHQLAATRDHYLLRRLPGLGTKFLKGYTSVSPVQGD